MREFSLMFVIFGAGMANAFAEQPAAEPPKSAKEVIEDQLQAAEAEKGEAQETVNKKDEEIKRYKQALGQDSQFSEFGFGLGFGNVFLRGLGHIDTAVVDQGVVRITDQEKNKLGVWLTTSWINDQWPPSWQWVGFGPFVGVQLGGTDDIVDSLAVGVAVSFTKIAPALPLDFQFGWGWTRINSLAAGYAAGAAVPEGVSQVLLRKNVDNGPVLIVSYKFLGDKQ
ncbi:MAG: hypothetical protein SXG53_15065 [Pseudomonadota bacterium]|nr:hypothetical protein [Pseudomonadota bacterium]